MIYILLLPLNLIQLSLQVHLPSHNFLLRPSNLFRKLLYIPDTFLFQLVPCGGAWPCSVTLDESLE